MKTALVTGASSGIGAAIAKAAAAAGYRVGVLDVVAERTEAFAKTLSNAIALTADVTDEAAVEAALDKLGDVPDLVVNNAGIVKFGLLLDCTVADFRRVLDVDLVGAYIVSRAAGKRMVERGSGCIVNITSINADTPSLGTNAYAAAKAGLANMTQLMSLELGPKGIRINAVSPGLIHAGMGDAVYSNQRTREVRTNAVPMRRLGTAEDIAGTVMFLASDAASYITGQELVVDGGLVNSLMAQIPRE
jgi:NAD(P)-dependent dehydrogenase (short-subunit alcohol dehydrogenase family)